MPLVEGAQHVFTWLDEVRARPGMYVASETPLSELETLIHGYYSGLAIHGIVEAVPEMTNHFSTWLRSTRGWSTSRGWAHAIRASVRRGRELDAFFELMAEYRVLRPRTLRWTSLAPRRRSDSGSDRSPSRIEIVRHIPTRLHFLRVWHGRSAANGWLLMTHEGSHATSIAFAKRHAAETLAASPVQWRTPE